MIPAWPGARAGGSSALFSVHGRPGASQHLGLRSSVAPSAPSQSDTVLQMVRALSQRLNASEKEREEESVAFNRKLYVLLAARRFRVGDARSWALMCVAIWL